MEEGTASIVAARWTLWRSHQGDLRRSALSTLTRPRHGEQTWLRQAQEESGYQRLAAQTQPG